MRGREMVNSERNVIGSCGAGELVVVEVEEEEDVLRVERRGFWCSGSVVAVVDGEGEEEEERRGVMRVRVGLCRMKVR